MNNFPRIGSEPFRQLGFKDQLEVISLQLFQPDEYRRLAGLNISFEFYTQLEYPPLPKIELPELPVCFLENYWAAYNCKFRPEWYGAGMTPMDEFGVKARRMISVWMFNFPFIAMITPVRHIWQWTSNRGSTPERLLQTAKVYAHLDYTLRDTVLSKEFEDNHGQKIYNEAMGRMYKYETVQELNADFPAVQETDQLLFVESQDLIILDKGLTRQRRWFYPLIPVRMKQAEFFRMRDWGWLTREDQEK